MVAKRPVQQRPMAASPVATASAHPWKLSVNFTSLLMVSHLRRPRCMSSGYTRLAGTPSATSATSRVNDETSFIELRLPGNFCRLKKSAQLWGTWPAGIFVVLYPRPTPETDHATRYPVVGYLSGWRSAHGTTLQSIFSRYFS